MKNDNNRQINSHMFLARSILNRFSYYKGNKRMINYIDTKTLEVKEDTPKQFNTYPGYYTDCNEHILMIFSESKIGNIIKKLEDYYVLKKMIFNYL